MNATARVIDKGIGPWELSADGTVLTRRTVSQAGEWPRQSGSWSQERHIPVRPGKPCRVVLVGESVARGFLLDPVLTLADLCRDAFRRAGHEDRVELVDLAANNLAPAQALTLCRAAVELRAQVIVLYVGNNFLRSTPWLEPETRARTAELFRTFGYEDYLAARRQAITAAAERFGRELEAIAAPAGVRVVVVVPATNLLDWSSPWVTPTWLPPDRLTRWAATAGRLRAVSEAGAAGERSGASPALARELTELDGGSTPRPLEILGQDLVRRGRPDEGLDLLHRSVSVGADPANYDRRCPPEVAAVLRRLGGMPGFSLVDVPKRLARRYGARAFGKDVFLDYCHHTPESLRLVADDIAAEVLAGEEAAAAPGSPEPAGPDVAAGDLADAYLLSALHNQHWGQSAEVVEHWLRAAGQADPSSVDRLAAYFAISTPDTRFWLSSERLGTRSSRMGWFLRNFSHQAVLDAELARRASRALDEDAAAALGRRLEAVRGSVTVEESPEVSLLVPYWRERNGPPQAESVFTAERDPECRYGFVTSGVAPIRWEAVLAAGPGLPGGTFVLLVNGRVHHEGRLTPGWQRHELDLPPAVLRPGVNELVLRWPAGSRAPDSMTSAIARLGLGPESLPLVRIARLRIATR